MAKPTIVIDEALKASLVKENIESRIDTLCQNIEHNFHFQMKIILMIKWAWLVGRVYTYSVVEADEHICISQQKKIKMASLCEEVKMLMDIQPDWQEDKKWKENEREKWCRR